MQSCESKSEFFERGVVNVNERLLTIRLGGDVQQKTKQKTSQIMKKRYIILNLVTAEQKLEWGNKTLDIKWCYEESSPDLIRLVVGQCKKSIL